MRLKPLPNDKRPNRRYDDLFGLLGGVVFLVLSELDPGWGVFWLIAGVIMLVWSAGSFLQQRFKR